MTAARRQTVAVDFDGVIHSYTSKWEAAHSIPDPPVEGAAEWINETIKTFDVAIYSTRASTPIGRSAIRNYLFKIGVKLAGSIRITDEKPMALLYLDDRAWRFTGPGSFPTVEEILAASPWNKRPAPAVLPDELSEAIPHIPISELRRLGYVQEVNRLFFHPLGLALEVTVEEDGTERLGGVWDYRDDPEGIVFDEALLATPEARSRAARIAGESESRARVRGYWAQPIGAPDAE